MRKQITRLESLKIAVSQLGDDILLPWEDYPCMEWTLSKSLKIYCGEDMPRSVRSLSFELARGPIPGNHELSMRCGNQRCIRPVHIEPRINRLYWLLRELSILKDDPQRPWSYYPCLEWPFARRAEYGVLGVDGKVVLAHRFALVITVGDIGDLNACHRCDNPPCWRPSHMFPATQEENLRDMIQKGRQGTTLGITSSLFGTMRYNAKLTDSMVLDLRRRYATGESIASLSRDAGISKAPTWRMLQGNTWKHIP